MVVSYNPICFDFWLFWAVETVFVGRQCWAQMLILCNAGSSIANLGEIANFIKHIYGPWQTSENQKSGDCK